MLSAACQKPSSGAALTGVGTAVAGGRVSSPLRSTVVVRLIATVGVVVIVKASKGRAVLASVRAFLAGAWPPSAWVSTGVGGKTDSVLDFAGFFLCFWPGLIIYAFYAFARGSSNIWRAFCG